MYEILFRQQLNSNIFRLDIKAPWIASSALPGQFVIIIVHPQGERIPLTICDIDKSKETVTLIFQVVGETTRILSQKQAGEAIFCIVGPLGKPSEIVTDMSNEPRAMSSQPKRLLFVAGGVGTAPIFPQVKWAHEHGIETHVVLGVRNKDLLFFEEEMRHECDHLYIMSDDGSYGEKGLVTDKVESLVKAGNHYDHCIAIGPMPMMKFVSLLTKRLDLPTTVSMNCMMVDGTGMCGACRVSVGGKTKFTCVDGPEFDGHQVDFDEAARRLATPDAKRYPIARQDPNHHCNLATPVQQAIAATRIQPTEQPPEQRRHNFDEVTLTYTPEQAIAEAKRCRQCKKPSCVGNCPVNIQIPQFINQVAQGNFENAFQILSDDTSLPAVCGRVCPQENQCEGSCILGIKGQPIAIGTLERFVADYHREHHSADSNERTQPTGPKVAIIGSGPSGLSCAHDLAIKGFDVTIFEALHHPGGVLVYGIPEFRLPKQRIVSPEIDNLRQLGVKILTNVIVGKSVTIDQLFDRHGFKAVYIATGAGLPKFMGIEGENLCGVISANELLTRTNLMHGYHPQYDTPIRLGEHVVVVGGGNVAMDAARTALRLGSRVTVVYRREEADMPARKAEIHHAKEEGIDFAFLCNPTQIVGDEKGNVKALKLIRMKMGEKDEKGRRSFAAIEGSEFFMEADNVVIALGTTPNPLIRTTTPGLDCEQWGGIKADEMGRCSRKGVFAGGDAVSGAATVILAMQAGRKAAQAIEEYCRRTEV